MISDILSEKLNKKITFTFNRKEFKAHGEKGFLLGHQYQGNENVVFVEDVITSGSSLMEIKELFTNTDINLLGIVVGINREENSQNNMKASKYIEKLWNTNLESVLSTHDILTFLKTHDKYSFLENEHPGITEKIKKHLHFFSDNASFS